MRKTCWAVWAGCGLLLAQSPPVQTAPEKLEISRTETGDFPTAGLLRMKNAVGLLTITGWDQPNLEMTTIKSTKTAVEPKDREQANKMIDSVKFTTERKGDEVTISTDFPKHSKMARPFVGMTDAAIEYRIHLPRAARLDISAAEGEINIRDVHGDLHATQGLGQINVFVPEGMYAIDARSKVGAVTSDFAGNERLLKWWVIRWPGQAFTASAPNSAQKMFLRVGYGDVIILRMR